MGYIVTIGNRNIARIYIDRFTCIDRLQPLGFSPLIFDTTAEAAEYISRNGLENAEIKVEKVGKWGVEYV